MKTFVILTFQFLILCVSSVYADTFHIITGKQVELFVTYKGNETKHYLVEGGEELELQYEKICAESSDSNYEIGIKDTISSLKKSSPCHIYTHTNNENSTSKKVIIAFNWIRQKLQLESNVRNLIVAEGRGDDDIVISKSRYPFMKLKFEKNDSIKEIKLITSYNDEKIGEIRMKDIFIKRVKIDHVYIIEMIGKDDKKVANWRFKIVE